MRHKSNNKTRPLFTLSLEMTRLVNKTRLLLVPGVNSDIYGTYTHTHANLAATKWSHSHGTHTHTRNTYIHTYIHTCTHTYIYRTSSRKSPKGGAKIGFQGGGRCI